MASYTPNYNLKKPADSDSYDIADANGNMDIIDTQLNALNSRIETYRPATSYTTLADIKSMITTLVGTMTDSQTKNVLFTTGTDSSISPFTSWDNYSGYVTKINSAGTYWVAHFISMKGNDVEVGCNNGTITAYSLNSKIEKLYDSAYVDSDKYVVNFTGLKPNTKYLVIGTSLTNVSTCYVQATDSSGTLQAGSATKWQSGSYIGVSRVE